MSIVSPSACQQFPQTLQEVVGHVDSYRRPRYRFGVAAGGVPDKLWHAVDLHGDVAGRGDVFSACRVLSEYVPSLGEFTAHERTFSARHCCEQCGWVVALNQGTVEQQIDLFVGAAGNLDDGLLREIFTSILADLPPGQDTVSGHRSDLLAHAAQHRPTVQVCEDCADLQAPEDVHGRGVTACPDAVLVCQSCTFTAGLWAGRRQGVSTGECVVSAPCSVLTALADHYELVPSRSAAAQ